MKVLVAGSHFTTLLRLKRPAMSSSCAAIHTPVPSSSTGCWVCAHSWLNSVWVSGPSFSSAMLASASAAMPACNASSMV